MAQYIVYMENIKYHFSSSYEFVTRLCQTQHRAYCYKNTSWMKEIMGHLFFYWFIYLCWHLNYLLILELLFFSMVKGVSHLKVLTTLTTLNSIRWYVVKATCLWYKPVCAHAVKAPSEHFMLLCSQTVTWGTAVLWWIFIFNLFINVV